MQLTTIDIPKSEAAAKLDEYRRMAEGERTAEDQRIAAGYRALSRGLPVIKLSESVETGGYFDSGLPRIAVVRATATQCWVEAEYAGGSRVDLVYSDVAPRWSDGLNRGALVNKRTVRVNAPRIKAHDSFRRGSTIVPSIPPGHRPKRTRLHLFHILWEVERWDLTPPKDPALLKFIGGDLWAVVATWDLTEIERAVLAGRR